MSDLWDKPYDPKFPLIKKWRQSRYVGFNDLSARAKAQARAGWTPAFRQGAWKDIRNWAFAVKADGSIDPRCRYIEPMRSIHDPDVVASLARADPDLPKGWKRERMGGNTEGLLYTATNPKTHKSEELIAYAASSPELITDIKELEDAEPLYVPPEPGHGVIVYYIADAQAYSDPDYEYTTTYDGFMSEDPYKLLERLRRAAPKRRRNPARGASRRAGFGASEG